ncbi:MAG: LytTR family DNA-binding domain-containing protein [Bacteroidota bacterium]
MNYLIIDDEPIAHRIIEGYCAELPHLHKVGNAYHALEASKLVAGQSVDLIFLDIKMPKMTGFEWLKTLPQAPAIIVTTAYKEYALQGYELDITDYLLKPFSFPRFLKAVNKVQEAAQATAPISAQSAEAKTHRFFLKGDKMHHQIDARDILYVEAYGNYCKVYLREETLLTHEKISALETLLGQENFLRIHKSFLVAVDKIKRVQGNMVFVQDHEVPIGQTYRSRVTDLLGGR